jgi:hypothetical protein
MGKESQNDQVVDAYEFSPSIRGKVEELVALLADEGFGVDGPPRETDFATIEAFGHQAGRAVARAFDEHLTQRHAKHFQQADACPTCGATGEVADGCKERPLQTCDGTIGLSELAQHCPTCDRDFFPSACGVKT